MDRPFRNDVRRFTMKRIYGCKVSATTYDVPVTYFDSETNTFKATLISNTTVRNSVDLKREVAGISVARRLKLSLAISCAH